MVGKIGQNQKKECSRIHSRRAVIGVGLPMRKHTEETSNPDLGMESRFPHGNSMRTGTNIGQCPNTYRCAFMYGVPNKYVLEEGRRKEERGDR